MYLLRSFHVTQSVQGDQNEVVLFDFTVPTADVDGWIESSDTVRTQGMSKASMVLQKTHLFQRAIIFCMLNPQQNGAAFAGVRKTTNFDLSKFTRLDLKLRGQGVSTHFKVVLRHHGESGDSSASYEQCFEAPTNEMQSISLPMSEFKAYWRGQLVNNTQPLDTSNITSFGIQYYGGVYSPIKQSGPATLEIDSIKAHI